MDGSKLISRRSCTALLAASVAEVLLGGGIAACDPSNARNELEWSRSAGKSRALRPQGRGARALGALPAEASSFEKAWQVRVAPTQRGQRPTRVLLTDFLPPVGDQGEQQSCVAWTTAYYTYTYLVAKQQKLNPRQVRNPHHQFSPAFIYNLTNGGTDEGIPLDAALRVLQERGCATLAEMPYTESDFSRQPEGMAKTIAERHKARGIGVIFRGKARQEEAAAQVDGVKTFLNETRQPFVLGLPVYNDFPLEEVKDGFVYRLTVEPKKENYLGLHAVTILGYDDEKRAFRMVNSWGEDWGEKGYLWISEDYIRDHALDGFTIIPGGPMARSVGRPGLTWTPRVSITEPAETKAPAQKTRG